MISEIMHRAVLIQKDSEGDLLSALGFSTVAKALSIVEEQLITEDRGKAFSQLSELFTDGSGIVLEGVFYEIIDVDTYLDLYTSDEDDE